MTDGSDGFRSAEEFLADLGVERDPIHVTPVPRATEAPVDAARVSDEPRDETREEPRDATPPASLDDEVRAALAFIRRSTASQPASEGRLRSKLAAREVPPVVVEHALRQARTEGLVDDEALLAALVSERRERGHARTRIRADLRTRGFTPEQIDAATAARQHEDPEAVAFAVGRRRAESLRGVDAETAYRRLVGFLARRGHPEWIARKVAREVVYVAREAEQIAGH